MPVQYKMDILQALKQAGYSSTRLRNEKLMGESYMQQLRRGDLVSWKTIETVCKLLNCQPGDLVEYIPEERELNPEHLPLDEKIQDAKTRQYCQTTSTAVKKGPEKG